MEYSESVGTQVEAEMKYVDRGDVGAPDFTIADITQDFNQHPLDLSAIVGATAKVVHLKVVYQQDGVGGDVILNISKNGAVIPDEWANSFDLFKPTVEIIALSDLVSMDAGRKIQYAVINTGAGVLTKCNITVRGWLE